ncbi:apses-domain-containing protein [Fistulina hepatica ATCC 64428]|uniref:Apses-domain-containing protein n=1 Tax=Fistulina hepatica ATCC 64428 TaxID=1128425 RepID=A0A0D7A6E7_9AGAR|nr:apses-domain-containing protein [Fistulina hepatica ATCC 64428]
MPETQIFKATYSGVPVYEMMCKGVAVMRRRSDSWLNATQILKVAGFDKPQRTRVLEREVQKGEHEKVQGGYGKYQGTWIPLERGLSLAKQYGCENILRPIIEFQPASMSPPPAPKHFNAPPSTSRPSRRSAASGGSARNTRSSKPNDAEEDEDNADVDEENSQQVSEDGSVAPSPSDASTSSRTPSPIHETPEYEEYTRRGARQRNGGYARPPAGDDYEMSEDEATRASYSEQILEYFISDTNQIPQVLVSPPLDFDPNMPIDDDGHAALHWACAMGRIRIAKLLLSAGADVFKVNKAGQTALMRSVMFANNYDVRKFPELYELLHRSTLNIDNYNRTVFHHIVDVAMSKGKVHAARYYMESILNRLSEYPKELADVINFQDEDGETALTMAARCRSKRLVKLLLDHGADPKIMNNDGKSTEDFILEDERFRGSPGPSSGPPLSYRLAHGPSTYPFGPGHGSKPPMHYSTAAQKASTRCVNDMASMLDSLATSFDQELRDKERDVGQAHALLTNIQSEILESQRSVTQLRTQCDGLSVEQQKLTNAEATLSSKMGMRYRMGWEKWLKGEEAREHRIRAAASNMLNLTPETSTFSVDGLPTLSSSGERSSTVAGKRRAEDVSDLVALWSDLPTDSQGVTQMCEALREEIGQAKKRRKVTFDELVKFQAEAGTSSRMNEYRRLIGSGCGGIPPSEVDAVLGILLETLEADEPTASSAAWAAKAASFVT